jgi:hypothetical protein
MHMHSALLYERRLLGGSVLNQAVLGMCQESGYSETPKPTLLADAANGGSPPFIPKVFATAAKTERLQRTAGVSA